MSGYTEIALLQYELEKLRAELAKKDAKIERLKTVPMMYRRMAFNAQLQDENNELRQQVTEKDEVIAEAGEMLAMRDRQLAALKEENESLKLDAARYQWLKSQEPSKHDGYAIGYFDACGVDAWRMTTKDLDQAIDAAIAKG